MFGRWHGRNLAKPLDLGRLRQAVERVLTPPESQAISAKNLLDAENYSVSTANSETRGLVCENGRILWFKAAFEL